VRQWGRHLLAHSPEPQEALPAPETAQERAPRPIWLPQLHEPVTLLLASGERLPGRVLERSVDGLLVAIVIPTKALSQRRLRSLVLEYPNPGGRVSLSGKVKLETSSEGALVRIDQPQLLDVRQERAHVRVQVECPIAISASVDSEPIHTFTEDLSGGGALLGTRESLRIGDLLSVHLTVDPAEPPLACTAEVVRIDGLGRAGLQFAGLSTYDRWRLVHFTVECQSREDFRHPTQD
jgi:PilZ domain